MNPLRDAWYMALASPHGWKFLAEDPTKTRQALYREKRKLKDPLLDSLSVVLRNEGEVWIIHQKDTQDGTANENISTE